MPLTRDQAQQRADDIQAFRREAQRLQAEHAWPLDDAPLALPNIATWWCGQEKERKHVVEHLDRMMIGPALSTRLPFEDGGETVLGLSTTQSDTALTSETRDQYRQQFMQEA